MAFTDVIWDINTVLYGITAGIAILMITLYGIKWKIAEIPKAREDAKRGILNVILGLAIVIIAANLVGLMFGKGTSPTNTTTTPHDGMRTTTSNLRTTTPSVGRTTTPGGRTTTTDSITTRTTTTITTTTTTTIENYLTADNLAECINSRGGELYANFNSCPACARQRRVFTDEKTPPVGPGEPAFNSLNIIDPFFCPCPYIPCWTYGSENDWGCKTMRQLNSFFDCDLIPYPGHSYRSC